MESVSQGGAITTEGESMSTTDRLDALRQRHFELDRQVNALSASTSSDDVALVAVKRQKLAIKDEITTLDQKLN